MQAMLCLDSYNTCTLIIPSDESDHDKHKHKGKKTLYKLTVQMMKIINYEHEVFIWTSHLPVPHHQN